MKYRTAFKTGRTAAMQVQQLRSCEGSFTRYVAMVECLTGGYGKPLERRVSVPRPAL